MVERKISKCIKVIHSDQGGEHNKACVVKYYKDHGIQQQFTVPHTPQQSGVAESKNKTLVECARNILIGKNLSNGFSVGAINTALYLNNRSPTRSLDLKTPFEALFGYMPTINHLRGFGSKAVAHVAKEDRKKLDSKAIKCDNNEQQQEEGEEDDVAFKPSPQKDDQTRFEVIRPLRRSGRKALLPTRYRENVFITSMMNVVEPSSHKEAIQYSEWMAAMEEEHESILKIKTWDLVKLPEGKQPIGCKSLYKPKFKGDGSIDKYIARLVPEGYSQQEGIDYDETFALVGKLNTIRMIIALAIKHHWMIHELDVKSCFLTGDLKEEVYLVQPKGFFK
eukprot:PITA_05708